MFKQFLTLTVFLLLFSVVGTAQKPEAGNDFLPENPSLWVSESNTLLNGIFINQIDKNLDTAALFSHFRDYLVTITMLKSSFYGKTASLNIRTVHNIKMRVADILADITKWQRQVHRENEALVLQLKSLNKIKSEIRTFRSKADSIYLVTFHDPVNQLDKRQQAGETIVIRQLQHKTNIEEKINGFGIQVYLFYSDLAMNLHAKESALLQKELPPVWASPPSVYPNSIGSVLSASFDQVLESVKYYGEMSMWRIIIFRGLIVLLCLVPIKIFHDKQRKHQILGATDLTFLGDFPKTATVVMGMALAPLVFTHPPHAFMEMILIGLTFTVTMLTLKQYPLINKSLLGILIVAFLLLYIINFFVNPTFIGRLIYTTSIFLLIPVYKTFIQVDAFRIRHGSSVKVLLILLSLHLVAGWIMVILGRYTLGKSVILAGYGLLIIGMIMRIAIYTFLDYIAIIAYFFNRNLSNFRIDTKHIIEIIKPFLIITSMIFILVAYLYSMNLNAIAGSWIRNFLFTTRTIGSTQFA